MNKKILLRVDASPEIGTGHMMRCLALANEAKQRDWECIFVLRDPDDEIVKYITSSSHEVEKLMSVNGKKIADNATAHSNWLPVSQIQDANDTVEVIDDFKPDWIIVDHYALDAKWFSVVEKTSSKILVIDDLGDRNLICDLLLDQNLGASADKYDDKLPSKCRLLLGPTFALLRREFREWRQRSLERRLSNNIENVLITMGGVDLENYTLQVLKRIAKSKYSMKCAFTVITGRSYPFSKALEEFINESDLMVSILSNIENMAEIMSKSDLCIGAAGSTSWERCCLGLPTISLAIADNQLGVLAELEKKKCTFVSSIDNIRADFERLLSQDNKQKLRQLSFNSANLTDGNGIEMLLNELEQSCDEYAV